MGTPALLLNEGSNAKFGEPASVVIRKETVVLEPLDAIYATASFLYCGFNER